MEGIQGVCTFGRDMYLIMKGVCTYERDVYVWKGCVPMEGMCTYGRGV